MSRLIAYAVPFFIALLLLEVQLAKRRLPPGAKGYQRRDTWASLSMGVANVVIAALTKAAAVGLFFAAYQLRFFDLGTGPGAWVLLFFAEDFCYYWFHRFHHEVRFFWAAHVNHHSSRYFNLSTALRQSWTTPLTGPIFWVPLALLGFHPFMILTAQAISLIYQFWIHTELIGRLGPLEWVFNTPSHHRVHHGANVEYLDRNYGGILIVWDRLFGSFEPERSAGRLRPHQEHRDLSPGPDRVPRVAGDVPRRLAGALAGATRRSTCSSRRAGAPTAARSPRARCSRDCGRRPPRAEPGALQTSSSRIARFS